MASELSNPPVITSEGREMTNENVSIETIKKTMFKKAMRGLWDDVVTDYQNPVAQEIKITRSGDTLIHVAVFDGQVETVRRLVDLISNENASKILKMENHGGNTPLHLAAALGSVEMCECIAARDSSLIGARNHDGETPLFLAALHGKKQAFLCLHSMSQNREDLMSRNRDYYSYCRRNDGETILHCAIMGEYFGE
ncbi:Ankyrin repeat [Macleaya cordata]|uniref:Ankyrin repeat n=1 Tax=Macleaya cordata TaxID=56857 RepID=A0A200PZ05_MACCD|nr:Ankyrin repeat [Macleaya cordata]